MKQALLLAFRYVSYYRARSAILLVCVSVALFLPMAVHVLVGQYNRIMIRRAEQTPLLVGAAGSVYDLVLNTLYFKGRLQQQFTMEEVHRIRRDGLATPVPVYNRFTAGGLPIVGTTLDYFQFRSLDVQEGRLPQVLGDVVLGARAARQLDLATGDKLLSDDEKLYDISSSYPLLMNVVGVLTESGTADDLAVFADLKTTWIIEGIGHGHAEARQVSDPAMLRGFSEGNVIMSGAVVQSGEITPDELESFHFHGAEDTFPITAIIALPRDRKSATILKARYASREDVQAVLPSDVVLQMMEIVFRVKRFFDAVFLLVLLSTGLFLVLVVLLSMRIRKREFETLHKIGCSRSTVVAVQAAEIGILLLGSFALAALLLGVLVWYVTRFGLLL